MSAIWRRFKEWEKVQKNAQNNTPSEERNDLLKRLLKLEECISEELIKK